MGLYQSAPKEFLAQSWTVQQALIWAATALQAEGLPDPRLSAELLLGSVLGLDRLGLLLAFDQTIQLIDRRSFEEKVSLRAVHQPVAYLTGHKEFWSLTFEVNPGVLIPRPETELLVEEALKILSEQTRTMSVVELGTGSGAVAIALAKSHPVQETLRLWATDYSWSALRTAQKNALQHGVRELISFVQADWLSPFSFSQRWIDLLVSNPPYISEPDLPHLPQTVKGFEPLTALSGGPDGLDAIRIIIQQASRQLKRGGWLILEIGETQGSRVLKLAQDHFFNQTTIRRDYAGKDRILKACYHG
jgi:release factor glutamine methyltransferase